MGAACSGTSLAILDTAIAAEVVMVSPSNTSPQFTKMDKKGFYARTAPSDLLQGDVLASLLLKMVLIQFQLFQEQTLMVEV